MPKYGPYRSTDSDVSFRSEPYRSLGLARSESGGAGYESHNDDSEELNRIVKKFTTMETMDPSNCRRFDPRLQEYVWYHEMVAGNAKLGTPVGPAYWDSLEPELAADPNTASSLEQQQVVDLTTDTPMETAVPPMDVNYPFAQAPQMCMPMVQVFVPVPVSVLLKAPESVMPFMTMPPAATLGNEGNMAAAGPFAAMASTPMTQAPTLGNREKKPKELPPATEEEWEKRIESRYDGLQKLWDKDDFKMNQDIPESEKPVCPVDPEDRTLSKRDWEEGMQVYRAAWRRKHNVRKLEKMGFETWKAERAWTQVDPPAQDKHKNAKNSVPKDMFEKAVGILQLQRLVEMGASRQRAMRALNQANGNLEVATQVLFGL